MPKQKLKIAQLVLPWIALPPSGYAGTERVVYNLSQGLVKAGHQVSVFTVAESKIKAKVEYVFKKAFGLQQDVMAMQKSSFYPWMHVAYCFEKADEFDVIHSHAQFLGLPFAACCATPCLHTFHRTFEFAKEDEKDLVFRYRHLNFVSISNAQRVHGLNFIATVYNGIDVKKYRPAAMPKRDYIFWAGRVVEKKGPREAIKAAKKLGFPIILAGKITDVEYFKKYIKDEIDNNLIKFAGEVSEPEMIHLFQNAILTFFPAKWNEPFGLIPVESMACATPVVGYSNGGLKETVQDGVTGFLVLERSGVSGLLKKIKRILAMPQEEYNKMCLAARLHVIQNFSIEKMVDKYEEIYYEIQNTKKAKT